jgi:FdhD protein
VTDTKPAQVPAKVKRFDLRSNAAAVDTLAVDTLAVEEPFEIRIRTIDEPLPGTPVTVTMRTPGHDEELALGFLFSEGLIRSMADIAMIGPCGNTGQIMAVQLAAGVVDPRPALQRSFYTTSSCGVCGKSSIDAVTRLIPKRSVDSAMRFSATALRQLPASLQARQSVFAATGGLHAAALVAGDGSLLAVFEDVGRHNATDKLLGAELRLGTRRPEHSALLLSGRASFELLQKAAMAGIGLVAAIGAPSSLAVDMAQALDITLVGFLRSSGFNVYSGPQRIIAGP